MAVGRQRNAVDAVGTGTVRWAVGRGPPAAGAAMLFRFDLQTSGGTAGVTIHGPAGERQLVRPRVE